MPDSDMKFATARLVCAYLRGNALDLPDLAELIRSTHAALLGAIALDPNQPNPVELKPAISPNKAISPDLLICLDCGKGFKSLKHHLLVAHGQSPDEYRAKWGLNADYPLVAQNYSLRRAEIAVKTGLGSKKKAAATPESTTIKSEIGTLRLPVKTRPEPAELDLAISPEPERTEVESAPTSPQTWHRYPASRWSKTGA
jgi:predicted transcriptional regulator